MFFDTLISSGRILNLFSVVHACNPVILTTQEVEIRRIMVQSQPRQIV
jgi:hypothetical protein